MRLTLVNPPRTQHDYEELAPPLGLLRLAQVAERCGYDVWIEDYNLLWHLDIELRQRFYETALTRLLSLDADIYGFTSMAVDSHVALELARLVKEAKPDATVILGGTHFSAIAADVQHCFPWIDKVIPGEGEIGLARILRPDLTAFDIEPALSPDMYAKVNLAAYFYANPRCMVDLEAGRGCRFKCSFCYSPGHYSGARTFPIEAVLKQVMAVRELGAKHVWFIEDNFLNDVEHARELCEALKHLRSGLTWSCYATFPQLSAAVIESMAAAGCSEVFCGIDAVGSKAERAFQKAFLRGSTPMLQKLRLLIEVGIKPTFAFLVAPPSHVAGPDYDDTVAVALEAHSNGAETLLNPLTLYTGTKAEMSVSPSYAADCLQADLMMDVPEFVVDNPMARTQPGLFPFHSRYVPAQEWRSFLNLTHCVATLIHTYPKTLMALHEGGVHPTSIAKSTLERLEGWERLSKQERQQAEQDLGFFVIEEIAGNSPVATVLESERPAAA
jgi:B12 binding domain/Radical SAM superfamily